MNINGFEVDTERLRAAAARIAQVGRQLGDVHSSLPVHADRTVVPPATSSPSRSSSKAPAEPAPIVPKGPGRVLPEELDGLATTAALAEFEQRWAPVLRELADGYLEHADRLRAVADRYEQAEQAVVQALREAAKPC